MQKNDLLGLPSSCEKSGTKITNIKNPKKRDQYLTKKNKVKKKETPEKKFKGIQKYFETLESQTELKTLNSATIESRVKNNIAESQTKYCTKILKENI